jgi:ankyrin repeat protein
VKKGHEEVLKLLIEKGIELEPRGWNQTMLVPALRNGHETVVKLLTETNVDLDLLEGFRSFISLVPDHSENVLVDEALPDYFD